jgi:esterase/lipase superfamily enzyme
MKLWAAIVTICCLVVLSGCRSSRDIIVPPEPVRPADALPGMMTLPSMGLEPPRPRFDRPCQREISKPFPVTLFYGTNRNRLNDAKHYGATDAGTLDVGRCRVTIPPEHTCGQVETPDLITRVRFGVDPQKHVVLQHVERQSSAAWSGALTNAVQTAPAQEVFVYVHGFNTTFEEAAQRTAQLHFDLNYPGTALFFSWPSKGGGATGVASYWDDRSRTRNAGVQLHLFLERVAQASNATAIHVIAHSMGNLVLAESLKHHDETPWPYQAPLRQIILAAPDVGAKEMYELTDALRRSNPSRITIYTSKKDVALKASIGANLRWPVGLAWKPPFVAHGVDTIDATLLDCDFLGHACTAGTRRAMQDVLTLLRNNAAPWMRRWLTPLPEGAWTFTAR